MALGSWCSLAALQVYGRGWLTDCGHSVCNTSFGFSMFVVLLLVALQSSRTKTHVSLAGILRSLFSVVKVEGVC